MKKWNRNKILLILVGLISLMVVNVTSVAAHAVSTYSDDTYTTLKGDFLRGETVYGKGTSWAQEDMMQLRYFEQASTNVISHYCTTVTDTNVVYCEWTIPLWEPFTNHLLKLAVRDEGEDYWVFNDAVTTFWVMRCRSDSVCDDGIWCNGAETCVDYTCQDGARPEDDNVSCTDYICNETTHVVTHVANNGNCDDNLFCNGIEICDATNDCIIQAGTLPDCNDDMNCTVDSCIEGQDNYTCTNTPSNARCDDSLWCNGAETCDANLGCQAGTPPGTADNLDCTDDWCDEVDDMIVHTENHLFCDDGLWCNGGESCSISLGGCQAGYTKTCNDGVGCTDDSCNETTDSCDNLVNDGNCDNGLWCDGAETCDATDDCQAGTAPTPNIEDDGINCTDVVCDETTHNFTNVMNNANCDDGLFCNGVETCDIELDCLAGTAPDCGDPIFCTDDSCDEENNTCINIPNDAYCDDGNFCNGAEKCDITFDCDESGYGIPLVLDDGISWTIDSCDEVLNLVLHTPNHALCDDGIFCNGAETMGPDGSCQAGTAPDCDDAVGCTDDSCNETTDSCDNSPNDGLCDNGLWCDGAETCDALSDCQSGTAPDCDDAVGCTDDSCNEGTDSCDNSPNDGLCDNTFWCDGTETCDAVNDCQAGTAPVCAVNNLVEIATCSNDPDNNLFTWDYAAGFTSMCDETEDECTTGTLSYTHTCDVSGCSAECDATTGCESNSCSETYSDYCTDLKLTEYDNNKIMDSTTVDNACDNNCLDDCTCTNCSTDCSAPITNSYCVKDICNAECDGDSVWQDYCEVDEIRFDGICNLDSCGWSYNTYDCNQFDGWYDVMPLEYQEVPIDGEPCNLMKQKNQERRNYTCGGAVECLYIITGYQWVDVEVVIYDEDGDGVCDAVDKCGSNIPVNPWYAEQELKQNHYDSSNWPASDANYGCSCAQVLYCKPGNNNGEFKFGCSQGTMDIWEAQNEESWALDCQDENGAVVMEGISKPFLENTDGDILLDILDSDNDGDGIPDSDDDMIEDSDLPGDPDYGIPDWHPKSKHNK